MNQVKTTSGDYCFIANLLEEAPKTCEAFKKMLPLKSEFIHVRWSGEGIWIPYGDLRLGLDCENHTCLWKVLFLKHARATVRKSFLHHRRRIRRPV